MLRLYQEELLPEVEEDDTLVLTCRRCGRPFVGRHGWHAICHTCFQALRWLHLNR